MKSSLLVLTVLVDQHPNGDAAHVEAVQEVLNRVLRDRVHGPALLQLDHALGHRLDDARMPVSYLHQRLQEPNQRKPNNVFVYIFVRILLHRMQFSRERNDE